VYNPAYFNAFLIVHIIGFVCWFAGLFYLPRLFVYHAMTQDKNTSETFKVMEYKLNYYITHPAMAVTFLSGIGLMHEYFLAYRLIPLWLIIKLVLVAILFAYQVMCGHYLRAFKADRNKHSDKFYRIFNEVPTLLLIGIVILAVIR
jgi:putative membrane protein